MKDFYYILGVKKNATKDEIKEAYRKLSNKFHPDKNDGDDFFTERFKDILEAYEILSDPNRRLKYDEIFDEGHYTEPALSPVIEYFKANKFEIEFEEEITFEWKTKYSNKVTLNPFGAVEPIGTKTVKIKDFTRAQLLFELVASNSDINEQAKSFVKIKNKTYYKLYTFFKAIITEENKKEAEKIKKVEKINSQHIKNSSKKTFNPLSKKYLIALVIILNVIIYSIIAYKLLIE